MRGYVVEGVLTGAGAVCTLSLGLQNDTTLWLVVGMLLAGVSLACFLATIRNHFRRPAAAPPEPTPLRPRRKLGTRRGLRLDPDTPHRPLHRRLAHFRKAG
ncbi:hypothetical protein [Actinokineospora bangkokensis]|uniref:Uncharacterized protein n=1 Tax=Actinokineospora bangkokensis TaxID=1193682 RepID=A0A1Q9LPY4_9PSEU|nr:hypothetical protein [Actinokineospora bangkokensis]OLR94054.1 hypothetical protein BJP25_13850 [Actinokineospora bangkokensis]